MCGITIHYLMKLIVQLFKVENVIRGAMKDTRNVFVFDVWCLIHLRFFTCVKVIVTNV